MIYILTYLGTVVLVTLHLFISAEQLPKRRRRLTPESASKGELRSAVTAFQGLLRVHLLGSPAPWLKNLLVDAAGRGCELRVCASLNDEPFLRKLLSLGVHVRVSTRFIKDDPSAELTLGHTQMFGWLDSPRWLESPVVDAFMRVHDLHQVELVVTDFDRTFALWTPYGGDTLADIPDKRVDTMMQRLETDPAVSARWDQSVRPKNLSALVLIVFIVASIVWTTIRLLQLESGAWLLPHIVVTFVVGQLLGVLYQTRFSRMKRELMQLQSDVLRGREFGAEEHEKLV